MTAELMLLEVRDRQQFRKWLAKHHASSPGVWLVFYKTQTGVKSMTYEEAVREALCFGWIDSLVKRLDAERYAFKVTPRKPASKWSETLERTRGGRTAHTGRARRSADEHHLRPENGHPGITGLHRQGAAD
jgi:uncharacterized protein YdeI (YjbR/CyaY-like superfamily)